MQEDQETPQNKPEETPHLETQTNAPAPKKTSLAAIILSVLSLCLSVVLILAILWLYFQNKETQSGQNLATRELEKNIMQVRENAAQQQQIMNLTQAKLRELIRLSANANQVWKFEEIEYLIKLAAYHLSFEGNTEIAIKLLETAKQKVEELNNPKLVPMQQAISNNIMALNMLPKIDVVDLITKLNAASQQINQLPIIPSQAPVTAAKPEATVSQTLPMWKRVWLGIAQSFHDMLIIRRHQKPVEPLLMPNQKDYLVENIQIQLSLAQWALLNRQPSIYQQSLQKAMEWIQHYFTQNASATKTILNTLTELQNINIKPTMPDLSDILNAIHNIKNEKPAAQPSSVSPIQVPVSS